MFAKSTCPGIGNRGKDSPIYSLRIEFCSAEKASC
jgi:hypothetical protein